MASSPRGATAPEDDTLVQAARTFVGISVRASDEIGTVSLVQLRALTVVDGPGEVNLMQLSDGMGVTVSTASRLVDRLIAAGLVDRRQSEITRREITLSLTPQGQSLLARYDELRVRALRDRLDGLSARRRTSVVKALHHLVSAVPASERP